MLRIPKTVNSILLNALLVVVSVVTTVALAEMILRFTPYKVLIRNEFPLTNLADTGAYLEKDSDLGHDIISNTKSTVHEDGEYRYEIFSNKYGCFDYEREVPEKYGLVVGDSFTWGYTPLDRKWTTYLERRSNLFLLKCGVSGYGTRQELGKAKKVIEQVGGNPEILILMYFSNDMNDDYLFPYIGKGEVEAINYLTGEVIFREKESETNIAQNNEISSLRYLLKKWRYRTVIYNIYVRKAKPQIKEWKSRFVSVGKMPTSEEKTTKLNMIDYLHQMNDLQWYGKHVEYHKQSLRDIIVYSKTINAKLLLIDVNGSLDNSVFESIINDEKINYFNLKKAYPNQSYWNYNDHWNIEGNQEAGKHIYQHIVNSGFLN